MVTLLNNNEGGFDLPVLYSLVYKKEKQHYIVF